MARAIELRSGAKTGRTGADDGDFLFRADRRRFRSDPAFFPALVDNRTFEVLDCDRRRVNAEDAGAFAGRRTNAASEFGKIISFVEAFEGLAPQAAINQIVPFGDQVVDGATR